MMSRFKTMVAGGRKLAPYLAVELFLPGGTLIALVMWATQQKRRSA